MACSLCLATPGWSALNRRCECNPVGRMYTRAEVASVRCCGHYDPDTGLVCVELAIAGSARCREHGARRCPTHPDVTMLYRVLCPRCDPAGYEQQTKRCAAHGFIATTCRYCAARRAGNERETLPAPAIESALGNGE